MCGNLARTPSSFNTWPVHLEFKYLKFGQYTNCTLGPVIMVHFCQNLLIVVAGAPEALQTKCKTCFGGDSEKLLFGPR